MATWKSNICLDMKYIITVVAACVACLFASADAAVPDNTLKQCAALGLGKQYRFEPPAGQPIIWPIKISELEKDGVTYVYEQADEFSWKIQTGDLQLKIFEGPSMRETRLVDVRPSNEEMELLFSHSQGYYYRLTKSAGVWGVRAWVNIRQTEFINTTETGSTITSVKLEDGHRVVIKRPAKPDAVYIADLDKAKVEGEGQGHDIALYLYRGNP